jgi:integrative and conjugative element protein (TIGR02256 family)
MMLRSGICLVEVADGVIGTITTFTAPTQRTREAGGILLGFYRGPHVQIMHCTSPRAGDRRFWNLFDRSDPGHQSEAIRRWRDSGRTMTYVGEWHTHPEAVPTPSLVDRRTWGRIARRHAVGPLVFVIRGTAGWYWELMRNKLPSRLLPLANHDPEDRTDQTSPNIL